MAECHDDNGSERLRRDEVASDKYTSFDIEVADQRDAPTVADPQTGTFTTVKRTTLVILGTGFGIFFLPGVVAVLGWVAGPCLVLLFALSTWYTSLLLAQTYAGGQVLQAKQDCTYKDAVSRLLGQKYTILYEIFDWFDNTGSSVLVIMIGSFAMGFVQLSNCAHGQRRSSRQISCKVNFNTFMILFVAIQVLLSQVPKPAQAKLYVAIGVLTLGYTAICVGLLAKLAADGTISSELGIPQWGSVRRVSESTPQKIWDIFNAVGTMAFAFSFADMVPQIQNTIKGGDDICVKQMTKAVSIAMPLVTALYMAFGCLGYAALSGHSTFASLAVFSPHWIYDILLAMLTLHMMGPYQGITDCVFKRTEEYAKSKLPEHKLLYKDMHIKCQGICLLQFTPFGLIWRTAFVCLSTVLALLLPFLGDLLGDVGVLKLFSTTIFLPIQMHIQQNKISAWSRKWLLLKAVIIVSLSVTAAATIGSVVSLVSHLEHYQVFDNTKRFNLSP